MTEFMTIFEDNETLIEESIVRLRRKIEDEKVAIYERIQRIEQQSKDRIRDAHRDFHDRVEPMQRQLDALVKAASLKHTYSTVPPVIISGRGD